MCRDRSINQTTGRSRDRSLLVGGYHQYAAATDISRDIDHGPLDRRPALGVTVIVQMQAQEAEVVENPPSHQCAVLADTTGKDHGIHPAHRRGESANVFADPVGIDLDRKAAGVIALSCPLLHRAQVGTAGETQKAGLAVQHAVDFVGGITLFQQRQQQARIDIATAGGSDQTLQGRQSHAGVHAAAVFHRGHARAGTKMGAHDTQLTAIDSHVPCRQLRHVIVAGAMKTESPQPKTFPHGCRDRIFARTARQRGMKGGIENRDMRHVRQQLTRPAQGSHRRGVVQRRITGQRLDIGDRFIGDQRGAAVALAAVNDPVSDGSNTREDLFVTLQGGECQIDGRRYIRSLRSAGRAVGGQGRRLSDPIHGNVIDAASVAAHDSQLYRRTAAVHNEGHESHT